MAELIAKSPAHGLVPVETAGARLTEAPLAPIWSIAPLRGKTEAVSDALEQGHGLPFPAPGTLHAFQGVRIAWSGLDQAFLMGASPAPELSRDAALSDQSDGWAHMILEGSAARAVLARLVPIDLAPAACPPGSARRTLLGHMHTLILHPGGDRFELLVFRSMAETAVHEVARAMTAVAARAAIGD
ncbi:sarcosine oxidase subunit gamma [Roseicyclus mahoneyensis]|uniref:Heterotetrameric sarcosine oxidase gamma subunit n=1 Tax=Roseicyclus mahoneyensis TaxID=164332 RepID=A0A316GN92_9RHOB|nr:sarcosine oxidase subunit gamma family protein [Roseicyclus mahoneyensis]PWK60903.1 heterotetrameric sarcosine oxidase gamma subunit [Roseicyclus mahoneyensis]